MFDDNKKSKLGIEMHYDIIPRIHDYGQLKLQDFEKVGESKDIPYYVMPYYEMNLEKYLA